MASIKPIISIRDISFSYRDQKILQDITIDIPENKFTVLLGRNGSGKSTLLRLIAGLLPLQTGSIQVDGHNLKKLTARQKAGILGFLPQKHKAVFPFSVDEVVLTGRASSVRMVPSKEDRIIRDEVIQMIGINHLRKRIYTDLSGGEQQLVMIARALAQQPKILLLDEPVSHLDYNHQIMLLRLLQDLVLKDISVVTVLHDPNLAFFYGDYFIFIKNQKSEQASRSGAIDLPITSTIFSENAQKVKYQSVDLFIPKK